MSPHVLMVEEGDLISAQHWAAMDYILQTSHSSKLPFGGVLVIDTRDPCQIPLMTGHNIFCSPAMITSFNIHTLKQFVRMEDP